MVFPAFVPEALSSLFKLLVVCTSLESACDGMAVNTLCASLCVMLPVSFCSAPGLGDNLYIYKGDVFKCVPACVANDNVPKTQGYVKVIMVLAGSW